MYLYVSEKEASATDGLRFEITLPEGLPLHSEIGLCEIHWNLKNDSTVNCFDIYCDVCDTAIDGASLVPILRRIHVDTQQKNHLMFNPVIYVSVIKPYATQIVLYLRGVQSDLSSVAFETLNCTLHVKQKQ